jgi:hypothetical protein
LEEIATTKRKGSMGMWGFHERDKLAGAVVKLALLRNGFF